MTAALFTWTRAAALALLASLAPLAQAHKASDAYLRLQPEGSVVHARIDVALRDLDRDLDLDRDADDALTWREVRTRWSDIESLVARGVAVSADGSSCERETASAIDDTTAPALTTHSDGRYAVLRWTWRCPAVVTRLGIDYRLFADTDPTHRGIATVVSSGADAQRVVAVLAPGSGVHRFAVAAAPIAEAPAAASTSSDVVQPASAMTSTRDVPAAPAATRTDAGDDTPLTFPGFVAAGIHHILIGIDHVLFLLSLLLPAVWVRREAADTPRGTSPWRPAEDWRPALAGVLKVVTAFTVAHSITLALAVFDVVDPPSRWVESLIAASVVAAALNNLWPIVRDGRWKVTFVFGLVHGFGFASALKDAGLARGALAAPLLGFNLGVELGQLAIVALVLPLAWALRGTRTYRGAFAGGSAAIASVAAVWWIQRAFDLQLIAG